MANNRLFLVHRPTGKSICLGKRMLEGWYDSPSKEDFQAFFDSVEPASGVARSDQDDFVLAIEDADGAPNAIEFDKYDERGPVLPAWSFSVTSISSQQ